VKGGRGGSEGSRGGSEGGQGRDKMKKWEGELGGEGGWVVKID